MKFPSAPSVSVVVPALNEESTIEFTLREIDEALSAYQGEIVIVDGGSVDRTPLLISEISLESKKTVCQASGGFAEAMRQGLAFSTGDVIVLTESDSSYNPSSIGFLVDSVCTNGADLAIGSRFLAESQTQRHALPLVQRVFTRVISVVFRLLFGVTVTDLYSNFVAFRRVAFPKAQIVNGVGPYIELIAEAACRELRIKEVPVGFRVRSHSSSKYRSYAVLPLVARTLGVLVSAKWRSWQKTDGGAR